MVALVMRVVLASVGDADGASAGDAEWWCWWFWRCWRCWDAGDAENADSAGDAAGAGVAKGFDSAGDAGGTDGADGAGAAGDADVANDADGAGGGMLYCWCCCRPRHVLQKHTWMWQANTNTMPTSPSMYTVMGIA